ncbi:MAG: PEP-CTERM sorting domain-containing protein [Planctomycetota bacterium]
MKLQLGAVLVAIAICVAPVKADILINEFSPNPDGTDPTTQTIELIATMGETSFSGFYGSIEGDGSFSIDRDGAINVTFDANGLATFDIPDLENPTFTLYISSDDHSGAAGIGDITTALDALGVPDNNSDTLYGATLGGTDLVNHDTAGFDNEPVLVFRDSLSSDWIAMYEDDPGTSSFFAFDAAGIQVDNSLFSPDPAVSTFGGINPARIPEPTSIVVLGAIALGAISRRRK